MDNNFKSIRDGYGQGLIEAGNLNSGVVVLTADLKDSTRCGGFASKYPERFIQCGIAEQNMMSVAAGLAMVGKIPFVNSFAVFNPGRNWDQLRVSVCYANLNVKIAGHHSGFSAETDGATHQALEDIAITRVLPNLVVLNPSDSNEVLLAVKAAAKWTGPVYIRLSKYAIEEMSSGDEFVIGKGEILKKGKDLTLAVSGGMVGNCLMAAKKLVGKIDVEVVKFSSIKPFDEELLIKSVGKTGRVLTVEDHQTAGGFGSLVCEVLSERHPVRVNRHGVYDKFGESGSVQELLKKYKLDVDGIVEKIVSFN